MYIILIDFDGQQWRIQDSQTESCKPNWSGLPISYVSPILPQKLHLNIEM